MTMSIAKDMTMSSVKDMPFDANEGGHNAAMRAHLSVSSTLAASWAAVR